MATTATVEVVTAHRLFGRSETALVQIRRAHGGAWEVSPPGRDGFIRFGYVEAAPRTVKRMVRAKYDQRSDGLVARLLG